MRPFGSVLLCFAAGAAPTLAQIRIDEANCCGGSARERAGPGEHGADP